MPVTRTTPPAAAAPENGADPLILERLKANIGKLYDFAIEKIKQNSRIYSRKQMAWFKRDKEITWFHPDQKEEIMNHINNLLS